MIKGDVGWLNASLKSTETWDELSTTCNPKVISRCLSAPDVTSLHHCLKNKQLKLIWFRGKDPVLFTVEEGMANTCMEPKKSLSQEWLQAS